MWLDLYGMLITKFHCSRDEARDQVPVSEAFALMAFNAERNSLMPMKRLTDGYIAQERFRE